MNAFFPCTKKYSGKPKKSAKLSKDYRSDLDNFFLVNVYCFQNYLKKKNWENWSQQVLWQSGFLISCES